ncbi:MAG: PAS domain S-box protein [Eubacteriales bacterium]|nr:PAS domain S-box protein [Eubacteriales bacterium]
MISIYKGLAFVTATAALIFYLVFRNLRIVLRESEERSQSEARLLEAQRLSHIGNFEWNLQTNRIMVSQEILSIFEVEDRIPDFGVESFLNLVHPDDRQRVEEEVNIALHSNFDASFLFRILPKDGNPRHVLVRLAPQTGTEKRSCVLGTIQDITDRVQAENSAKENEAIYKAFINSSCDLIYLKDHKLRYVAVNKSMQQFYGLEEKQLFGKTSSQIFQTPDALRWEQRDKQVMETGSVIDAEDVENGGTFETIIFPVDLSDQRRGVGGISRDISQYKRSEAAAKQERDRAQTYFDIAAIMNVVLDMDGIVVNINQAGCAKIGMSKTEIIGKHWISNFVPRQEQMYVNGFFNEVSKSIFCSDEAFENDILTSAGEIRKIEWRNAILKDSEGVPYGVFSAGVDVTELRQAMRALNESERSKSVLLSNLPGMAYRCSCDHKWTMQFVSSGCYELTGYFPEDIIHNKIVSFDEIICEEYREPIWKESNAHFLTLSSNRYEYEILTSSGKRKWVLDINQGLFDEDGKIEALEGIIIDITESKKQFLEIQYLNDHDQLTGLYNRLYFDRVRDRMSLEQWSPLAIIHADINGLKLINDAFGNTTGDGIIQKTAGLLADTLKEGDILARVGGDEFAMLLTGASAQDPAERVREIQNKFDIYNETLADRTLLINLSIGWAEKQDSHSDLVQVEKDAESNLSRRKLLDQKSHHNAVLASIMATLFERSFETEEHAKRISALCEIVGKRVGLSHAEIDRLKLFAYLHDIGKIGVSDQILNKTTSLDEEELHQMKKHPEIGYRIAMSSPEFAPVAELILAHHERWDGNGYPDRLAGKEIPLLARILAVADAYDAMTQDRVYRRALSFQEALEEIRKNAGTQFDPEIARVFLEVLTEKGNELSDSPR